MYISINGIEKRDIIRVAFSFLIYIILYVLIRNILHKFCDSTPNTLRRFGIAVPYLLRGVRVFTVAHSKTRTPHGR